MYVQRYILFIYIYIYIYFFFLSFFFFNFHCVKKSILMKCVTNSHDDVGSSNLVCPGTVIKCGERWHPEPSEQQYLQHPSPLSSPSSRCWSTGCWRRESGNVFHLLIRGAGSKVHLLSPTLPLLLVVWIWLLVRDYVWHCHGEWKCLTQDCFICWDLLSQDIYMSHPLKVQTYTEIYVRLKRDNKDKLTTTSEKDHSEQKK